MKEQLTFFVQSGSALLSQLLALLPAAVGATVALQFLGKDLPLKHRISSVLIGVVCGIYLAPVVAVWFQVDGRALHESLEFLIGLFAVAVGREIFREIDNGLITRIRDYFLGGGKQ